MRYIYLIFFVYFVFISTGWNSLAQEKISEPEEFLFVLKDYDAQSLSDIHRSLSGIKNWYGLGRVMVLRGGRALHHELEKAGLEFETIPISNDELLFAIPLHSPYPPMPLVKGREVMRIGNLMIVSSVGLPISRHPLSEIIPIPEDSEFIRKGKAMLREDFRDVVTEAVSMVSQQEISGYVETLADFETRYTFTSNFDEAGMWIFDMFTSFGLSPEFDYFEVGTKEVPNIIARINGITDEYYIVCAHYDSISNNPLVSAPGADDNASGTSGVIEIANILSQLEKPYYSVELIAFAAEELGLLGSYHYVEELILNVEEEKLKGVINLDMIGYYETEDWTGLIEGEDISEELTDTLVASATYFTPLETYILEDVGGSDHVPFLNAGIPAVLFIEFDWSMNENYHTVNDLPETLNYPFLTEMVKTATGAIALLAFPSDMLAVTTFSPQMGSVDGGTEVEFTGWGFEETAQVFFGENSGSDIEVESLTSMTCLTPPGDEGTVDITIVLLNGTSLTLPSAWTYIGEGKDWVDDEEERETAGCSCRVESD